MMGPSRGFDYSRQMIDVAKEKFSQRANVPFTTGDVLKYHFPEKHYDVVCCLNFYPHIASHSRDVIRRLYKAMVPVTLLIGARYAPQPSTPSTAASPCCRRSMSGREMISAGFLVVMPADTDRFYLIKVVKEAD